MTEDNTKAEAPTEPEAKKLRSSDEDLKVIVGSGNDEAVRWYHAPTLAAKSKYIDALLAAPMRESSEKVITFPDVSLETWDDMMKYLEDPVAARQMNAKDAIKVAAVYDKYDFTDGRRLCDSILTESFQAVRVNERTEAPDVDLLIDAVVLASESNLNSAFDKGMSYVASKINSVRIPYGRTMFSEAHMQKLQPLLLEHTQGLNHWDEEGVKKSCFPKDFVDGNKNWLLYQTFHSFISHIELSGCHDADGEYTREMESVAEYTREKTMRWAGVPVKIIIQLRDDGWAIIRETLPTLDEDGEPDYDSLVENDCWVSPCSANLPLPPSKGWKAVDPLATGKPKIKYILKEEGRMYGYG